ncbi:dihydrolipoamide acetyltransferase, long form protein [Actinidia rufa]|uniref:Dihydrolipoamide acetyltransferase, long form protein n=1 Tax=Actinidia rufa TaxID=165716 RepID=A0A7J0G007_9ERIC|nr:dihydrolipoamide acetyltransferase, long form protein [Actinidia rufa]
MSISSLFPSPPSTSLSGRTKSWWLRDGNGGRPSSTPGDWDAFSFTNNDRGMIKQQLRWNAWMKDILLRYYAKMEQKEIKVGEVIAITVEDEEDITKFKDYEPSKSGASPAAKGPSDSAPPKEEKVEEPVTLSEPKVTSATAASPTGDRLFASPLARKLAEDHNVTISSIKGTGPDGRIVKADIEDYLASRGKEVSKGAPKVDTGAAASLDYTDIPHTQIRKAAALALRKVPQCNSSWTNDYIRQFNNVNINVAVQTDNGLFVPVIRDADKKGLSKISNEVKILAQKAKENSLKPEDYEVEAHLPYQTWEGPSASKQFCAIINPPQSGILAVGSAEKRVIPGSGSGQYKFASFMSVTLSCDHRVIDGAIRCGMAESIQRLH